MPSEANWLDQVLELSALRENEEQAFQRAVAQVLEQHKNRVDRITTQEEQLWAMSDDLVVLVRTSIGAPKAVYHLADRPCGYALMRGFKQVLEGQARAERLTRCRSCRWPAESVALVSAP